MTVRAPSGSEFGTSWNVDTELGAKEIMSPSVLQAYLFSRRDRDVAFRQYNFQDIALTPSLLFTVTKDTDATTWVNTAEAGGGKLRAVTGTDDGGGISLLGQKSFTAALESGIEFRAKASAITLLNLEGGIVNANSDLTALACTDVDGTPTFNANATEAALWAWRPGDTIATPRFVTNGVGQTAVAKTVYANAWNPSSTTAVTPAADTYFTVRVQLFADGSAMCAVFGATNNLVSITTISKAGTVGGVTADTTLCPWFIAQNTTTTARNVDVQYIRTWTQRY